ncbi:MAG: membrane protein insertion efficiency factor YidD [Patescibacteria group bacterium]
MNKYQKFLSNDHSAHAKHDNYVPYCKYYPSCSQYSKEAIEKK